MGLKTPELDKMHRIVNKSQAVGDFLAWANEQGMFLCRYEEIDGYRDEQLCPIRDTMEELLAKYFEIDLTKVERERRAILRSLR